MRNPLPVPSVLRLHCDEMHVSIRAPPTGGLTEPPGCRLIEGVTSVAVQSGAIVTWVKVTQTIRRPRPIQMAQLVKKTMKEMYIGCFYNPNT